MECSVRPTVLIVEDDAAIRQLFGVLLPEAGFRPIFAGSTDEAVVTLARERPNAIVTDCGRPDGRPDLAALDRLRRAVPGVPLILCSAHQWIRGVDPVQYGLFAIVPKPFDIDELIATVGRAVAAVRS
jgi:two-component system nitrogen regulation response regulator GlnG